LPASAARPASYRSWKSALKGFLYQNRPLDLRRCKALKLVSEAGESEADFGIRLREAAREARDGEIDELRDRFATRLARIEERIRKAEERVEREESQYSQQKMQAAISVGATVLDAFLGRKKLSRRSMGRATTAMRGAGRASRERDDIRRAEESVVALRGQRAELEEEFARETEALRDRFEIDALEVETVAVAPRKADITINRLVLAWLPGSYEP
ncbi:MAG: ATP-binding protein, partial [marine benthic group bacterium]|nr:ATP-binding protein [Gemmatimonadota bacterium]